MLRLDNFVIAEDLDLKENVWYEFKFSLRITPNSSDDLISGPFEIREVK